MNLNIFEDNKLPYNILITFILKIKIFTNFCKTYLKNQFDKFDFLINIKLLNFSRNY
jgi:hypothetical protein